MHCFRDIELLRKAAAMRSWAQQQLKGLAERVCGPEKVMQLATRDEYVLPMLNTSIQICIQHSNVDKVRAQQMKAFFEAISPGFDDPI